MVWFFMFCAGNLSVIAQTSEWNRSDCTDQWPAVSDHDMKLADVLVVVETLLLLLSRVDAETYMARKKGGYVDNVIY